jgi:hypothetical protein
MLLNHECRNLILPPARQFVTQNSPKVTEPYVDSDDHLSSDEEARNETPIPSYKFPTPAATQKSSENKFDFYNSGELQIRSNSQNINEDLDRQTSTKKVIISKLNSPTQTGQA